MVAACGGEPAPDPEPGPAPVSVEARPAPDPQPPAPSFDPEAAEDFRVRFREARWDGLKGWEVADFVAGMRLYVAGDDPIYPRDDKRCWALHMFLFQQRPDPAGLKPLLGPRKPAEEVDAELLKRDLIGICVTTSFMRRLWEDPKDRDRAAMYDAITYAGVHFGFDPVYEASHTGTSEEVTDFFASISFAANDDSHAAMLRYLEPMIEKWRTRVTTKSSSTFFGIVMRHLGVQGSCRLFEEWERMTHEERYDLLKRIALLDMPDAGARGTVVESFLGGDPELREAAFEALEAFEAPLGELDTSSREEEIRAAAGLLRDWARKTKP